MQQSIPTYNEVTGSAVAKLAGQWKGGHVPVYMNAAGTYAELRLGQTIRKYRKERGWPLKELAARLSISIAKLSAIETDRAILDLELLVAIAEALGVRPDQMFPASPSRHYLVTHHAEMRDLPPAPLNFVNADGSIVRHANVLRPLADRFVGKHLEPFAIEIHPVPDEDLRFVSHHQHEFLFVIRGRVECLLKTPEGLERETLGPGDCCYFLSHLPHAIRALGDEAAHGIDIVHAPYATAASEIGDTAVYLKDGASRSLTDRVARQLTTLREAHGLSTADFARELQLSVRQLADLERGQKAMSMDVLVRACRRFRKPLEYFMSTAVMNRPFWCVRRASEIPQLPPRPRRRLVDASWSASEYRPLADDFGPREMFPYYLKLRLPPDYEDAPHAHLHEHHGQEFFYVLKGQVVLATLVDGKRVTETISAGDTCFIDSTVPHRFVGRALNPYDDSGADIINVYWCPLGESYLFNDEPATATT